MGAKIARLGKALVIILAVNFGVLQPARAQVIVFAAASLAELIVQIGDEFELETGIEILVSTAGSSTLARQIIAGAPADIFISANPDLIAQVQIQAGYSRGTSLFYNRLVVVGSPTLDMLLAGLDDLPIVIGGGRLALGDPHHVPAGIYAKQALISGGVWEEVSNNLAPASNVRAALALVQAGAAPVGIVYASDIKGTDLKLVLAIDPSFHQQIIYVGALAPNQPDDEGKRFLAFLGSEIAHKIALEFGFAPNTGN